MPDATTLNNPRLERIILSGLMHEPDATLLALRERGFDKADFYHDTHQRLWTVCTYLVAGGETCGPYDCYQELARRRREAVPWLGLSVRQAVEFLAEVWCIEPWFTAELWKKAEPHGPWRTACALAAACEVQHLASRRALAHKAAMLYREAMNPADGPAGLASLSDELEDY